MGSEPQLVIRLLGDPEVRSGETPVQAFESARLRSLLGYLVVARDRPVSRARLAFVFWPDSTDGQARTNLRQALHHLRRGLGDADRYVRVDGTSVQWRIDSSAVVDVVTFEEAAAAGLAGPDEDALARAAEAYRGDLLAECYDDWLTPERERLRSLAGRVLHARGSLASQRRDWAGVLLTADRLLQLDPLDEAAHRLAIKAHASAGDRVRALRRYHEWVTVLDRELGVVPAPATVALYDALVAGGHADRPRAEPARGSERLPLIGRDAELRELVDAWERTARRPASFVVVIGEPGVGKTRLVEELIAICRRAGVVTVSTRAYEADGDLPYGPVIDVLRSDVMRTSVDELEPQWRRELDRVLPGATTELLESGANAPPGYRRRLFEAIGQVLVGRERRLVMGIDDLHWCDPDTFDLLESVLHLATTRATPLLVVATIRTEELACHDALRRAVDRLHAAAATAGELPLGRLDADAARELAGRAADGTAMGTSVEQIVSAADGNPLFLIEMARSGLVGGGDGGRTAALPPRVQAVIDGRLDRLSGAAQELLALAAVVGRSFTIELVGLLTADEHVTVTALDEVWRRGIVRESGVDSYDFAHDRIRDVAYHRLGPARRRALHAAVARALQASSAPEPGQIAYHLEHAGQVEAAIDAYRRAVEASARAFAHHDVVSNARRALRLVATRPSGSRRDDDELTFLVPLGVALMAGPGIADRDVAVYERARALRSRRGLAVDPSTLRLSANAAIGRREYRKARQFGESLLQRGLDEHDGVLVTEGRYLVGVTSFWLGELDRSARSLQDALAAHDARFTPVHLERFGQDPRSVCLVRLALTSFHLGDDTTAVRELARALDASAELGHEYTDVYVRMFAAWYFADSGQPEAAADVVRAMPPTTRNSTAAVARSQFAGWALTAGGDPTSGIQLLHEAQQMAHHHGPQMFEPSALILLARSRMVAGDVAGARDDATAALVIATAQMPFHAPEAMRLVGELELATGGDPHQALERLERSAALAASAGEVVHELRARTSLLHVARIHAPATVAHHADVLAARCAELPAGWASREVFAARDQLLR